MAFVILRTPPSGMGGPGRNRSLTADDVSGPGGQVALQGDHRSEVDTRAAIGDVRNVDAEDLENIGRE